MGVVVRGDAEVFVIVLHSHIFVTSVICIYVDAFTIVIIDIGLQSFDYLQHDFDKSIMGRIL